MVDQGEPRDLIRPGESIADLDALQPPVPDRNLVQFQTPTGGKSAAAREPLMRR